MLCVAVGVLQRLNPFQVQLQVSAKRSFYILRHGGRQNHPSTATLLAMARVPAGYNVRLESEKGWPQQCILHVRGVRALGSSKRLSPHAIGAVAKA